MDVGTSLIYRLVTRKFTEDETRGVMRQLLEKAEERRVAGTHRRVITPNRILVAPGGAIGTLKIRGFGRSVRRLKEPEDVVMYCSPRQLKRRSRRSRSRSGPADDVWALGCVMAEMITGWPLFPSSAADGVLHIIKELRHDVLKMGADAFYDMPELSLTGRELLLGLLCFDADTRLTAADALKHRWFTEEPVAVGPAADAQAQDDKPTQENE